MLIRGFILDKKTQQAKRDEMKKIEQAMRFDNYHADFIERAMRKLKENNRKYVQKDLPQDVEELDKRQFKQLKRRA